MSKLIHIVLALMLVLGVVLAAPPIPAQAAATFTVNSTFDGVDTNPGDGLCKTVIIATIKCTLRAAIMEANALAGADTVNLPAGTYILTRTGSEDAAQAGDLDITGSVTIIGSGPSTTFVDGNQASRVFEVWGNTVVTLSNLTIQKGAPELADFSLRVGGGGIHNFGQLTLNSVVLTNNNVFTGDFSNLNDGPIQGGGLLTSATGSVVINDSLISNNKADMGGGLFGGSITVVRSTISGNSAFQGGGAGTDGGSVSITASTVSNNVALLFTPPGVGLPPPTNGGGGIAVSGGFDGVVNLVNSTVSGNLSPLNGGGLLVENPLAVISIASATIANNTADSDQNGTGDGGGVFVSVGTLRVKNTIVANNLDRSAAFRGKHPDCSGTLTSQGFNLIRSTSGCTITGDTTGNVLGQDPVLGPLQNNGGPTFTHLLDYGPALDAGNPGGCTDASGNLLATDQRGSDRNIMVWGSPGRCDIGATELWDDL